MDGCRRPSACGLDVEILPSVAGTAQIAISAPDIHAGDWDPSPPGAVYVVDPDAPSGPLPDAGATITGAEVRFGECIAGLGDVDGDGHGDLGICTSHAGAVIMGGPLGRDQHVDDALVKYLTEPGYEHPTFFLGGMARLGDGEVLLAPTAALIRQDLPVAGEYAHDDPSMHAVNGLQDYDFIRGSGQVGLLAGFEEPLIAFSALYPTDVLGGVGVMPGHTEATGFDDAVKWRAREPDFRFTTLSTGDVSGDGRDDVILGNPSYNRVMILTDPLAGGELADADIVIDGPAVEDFDGLGGYLGREWFGAGVAAGDLDHDGIGDLIVGLPGTFYFEAQPGRFAVFLGPLEPGHYTLDDAVIVGRDSDSGNDHFASAFAIGDLDGDGYNELVVGSRHAPSGGVARGMVTVYPELFGRPPRRAPR